ncbi:MAG: SGNH/GDSL hydrolase family protein [Candidatus Omnitrophota bacterium]
MQRNKKLKILGKILLSILFTLCLLEITLRIFSNFYVPQRNFPKKENQIIEKSNSFKIMAIGDSWTEGAGAKRGQGYVNAFLKLLRREYSNIRIESFNYARGSFNSSQACLQLLKHYKEDQPHLLIILMGINNGWNTQDVSLARKLLNEEVGFEGSDAYQISIREKIFFWLNRLRIIRLIRILHCNLTVNLDKESPDAMVGPHPMDSDYVGPFFEYYAETRNKEKAKEYLIKHIDKAHSYDDFYRLMLYLFDHHIKDAEVYLRERGLWRPQLIKFKFNQSQHDSIVSSRHKILEENIVALKKICDLYNIKMIVQGYPQYGQAHTIELNSKLFEIARKVDVPFVDHYVLFSEILGVERFKEVQSVCSHVNTEGHHQMAENLYKTIVKLNWIKGVHQMGEDQP